MRVKDFFSCFLHSVILLPVLCIQAQAQGSTTAPTTTPTFLQQQIRTYLKQSIDSNRYERLAFDINDIDNRLNLNACDNNLAITTSGASSSVLQPGRLTLQVTCESSHTPWKIYVPVVFKAWKKLPVLNRSVGKGYIIQSSDIQWQLMELSQLRSGYIQSAENAAGMSTRRPLDSNTVLYHSSLSEPDIISKGDSVRIIARIGAILVTSAGVAQQNGSQGQLIDIKNSVSQRLVQGRVVAPNTVELNL